jgi:predicted  nucleic acid-binding Zn-ribbon protein
MQTAGTEALDAAEESSKALQASNTAMEAKVTSTQEALDAAEESSKALQASNTALEAKVAALLQEREVLVQHVADLNARYDRDMGKAKAAGFAPEPFVPGTEPQDVLACL